MRLLTRKKRALALDEPLRHPDHRLPLTRREFVAQGFLSGGVAVAGASALSMFANPRAAYAALAPDLQALKQTC